MTCGVLSIVCRMIACPAFRLLMQDVLQVDVRALKEALWNALTHLGTDNPTAAAGCSLQVKGHPCLVAMLAAGAMQGCDCQALLRRT